MPPLGLAYLSAYLKKNGCDAKVLDLSITLYNRVNEEYKKYWESNNGYRWYLIDIFKTLPFLTEEVYDEFVTVILAQDREILGFSIQNTSALFTLEIIKRIKLKDPSRKIILGGPNCYNVSVKNDDFKLKHGLEKFADIIVIGEGEKILLELLRRIELGKPLKRCRGIALPARRGWIFNGFSEPVRSLDDLPFPDFDSYDLSSYTDKNSLPILTSRGCVMRCVFCTDTFFWRPYRFRSPWNVVAEIMERRRKYHNRVFSFNDSLINGNYENFSDLCKLLTERKLDILWGGNCRIDRRLTQEFLEQMKKTGCEYLIVGVESGSNKILKLMHKGFSTEEAERFIFDCYKAGIKIIANWIVGFPGETEREFAETVNFIRRNEGLVHKNTFSVLAINQFSYLDTHRKEFGVILEGEHLGLWRSRDGKSNIDIRNARLNSLEEMEKNRDRDYRIVRQTA
jgi:radical SAM superfamily enzyme YgiQ (UPF0313 family)